MDKEWMKNGWATIIAHHHATHLIMPRRNLHYSGETRIARCSLLWTMLSPSTKVIFIVAWIHLSLWSAMILRSYERIKYEDIPDHGG